MARYTTYSMNVGRSAMWYIVDSQTGQEVYRGRDKEFVLSRAEDLNRQHDNASEPADIPETTPEPAPVSTVQPGWSKAARYRAGRIAAQPSHPFGEYVERTESGGSVYEDTTFGGGRVVIYDES